MSNGEIKSPEILGVKKKKNSTVMYFLSFPVMGMDNGDIHVVKRVIEYDGKEEFIGKVGAIIMEQEEKAESDELMFYPLSERKFLAIQEKIAVINNNENKALKNEQSR